MLQTKKMCCLKQGKKKERNLASKGFLASSAVFSIAVLLISIQIASGRETDLKKPIYDGNDEAKAFVSAPSTSRYIVSKPEALTTTTNVVGRKNRTLKSSKSKGKGSSKGSGKGKGGTYCGDPSRHFQFYRDCETLIDIHSVEGTSAADEFGEDVSISGDGKVVAVGASTIGEVKIYSDPTGSGSFSQVGPLPLPLPNTSQDSSFGFAIDLNYAGNIVAVCSPNDANSASSTDSGTCQVFELSTLGSYIPLGQELEGLFANDLFGYSVSLNVAGNILAIGAPQTGGNNGYVNIYEWDTTTSTWSNTDVITGGALGDNFGFSVDLSDDGTVLAIGAPNADGTGSGTDVGMAYVYEGPAPSVLRAQAVEGLGDNDYLGYSVSLNYSGKFLAAGAPGVVNADAGYVQVYEYNSGTYGTLAGSIPSLSGTGAENFGTSVSLNYGGHTIVVGAPANDDAGTDTGKLYTYHYRKNLLGWLSGPAYTGTNADDNLGKTVVMSDIGDRLITGSQFYDGSSGTNSGSAVVLECDCLTTPPPSKGKGKGSAKGSSKGSSKGKGIF